MMKDFANKEIENYVNGLSEFQKDLVLKVREVVLAADPKVQEGIKWGSIAFYNKKNICGFRVAKAHVTLLFMEGASLNDKQQILNGTGQKARTIAMKDAKSIPAGGIMDLVRQAIKLGM